MLEILTNTSRGRTKFRKKWGQGGGGGGGGGGGENGAFAEHCTGNNAYSLKILFDLR